MTSPRSTGTVQIREYQPDNAADAEAFRGLNEEWISKYFVVEEDDRLVLGDPEGQILRLGGAILFAQIAGQTVGCCAVAKQHGDVPTYEIAKLAVTASFQGRQIGRKLMEAGMAKARSLGAKRLILVTNAALKPARQLYESLHFTYFTPPQASDICHYERGDTFMELQLE